MLNKEYKSKYFSVLGDSISTLFGYSEPLDAAFYTTANRYESGVYYPEDTWWGRVIEAFGGKLLCNDSFSGSTVCYDPLNEIQSYGCSDCRTSRLGSDGINPDVILVFMGINDRGLNARLRPSRVDEKGDLTIFSEAYSAMLSKLRSNYPTAEIWCLTLPLSSIAAVSSIVIQKSKEYSAVIKERAGLHSCLVVDIGEVVYDSTDGLHPNNEGMKALATAVCRVLRVPKP